MNQQNMFHIWRNNDKIRLAHVPQELPEDPAYPEDIGPINRVFEPNYRIQTSGTEHLLDHPNYRNKVLLHMRNAGTTNESDEHNNPDIAMVVPYGTVRQTTRLLHHLVREHDNIIPHINSWYGDHPTSIIHSPENPLGTSIQDGENYDTYRRLEADRADKEPYDKGRARQISPSIKVGGNIETPQDLAKVLSHAFSGILLHHLNNRVGSIQHPGMDSILDTLSYKTGENLTPHVESQKAIDQNEEDKERHIVNAKLAEHHRNMLEEYLAHHIKYPQSNISYPSFLEYKSTTPEHSATLGLLSEILKGKYKRG